jgi:hypothetical protein
MCKRESVDRVVKALGPDGGLRSRRYSQAEARGLLQSGVVVAIWNKRRDRIACIQFFGDQQIPTKPQRWLKTGTRYSYPEQVGNLRVWTHKPLPYRMVRADWHEPFGSAAINDRLRSLFAGTMLSTAVIEPATRQNVAPVVSIESHRPRAIAVGSVEEEELALAA